MRCCISFEMIFHTLLFQRSGGDSCCVALPGFFKGRIFLKRKNFITNSETYIHLIERISGMNDDF